MVHSSLKVSHCENDSAMQSTASAPFCINPYVGSPTSSGEQRTLLSRAGRKTGSGHQLFVAQVIDERIHFSWKIVLGSLMRKDATRLHFFPRLIPK